MPLHGNEIYELRRKKRLTQAQFWHQIGVAQSTGSRYESGAEMPTSVALLIDLRYRLELDVTSLEKQDVDVLKYLKGHEPGLFRELARKAAFANGELCLTE